MSTYVDEEQWSAVKLHDLQMLSMWEEEEHTSLDRREERH